MLAGGALAAAGSSWLLDWPIWADGAVFLVVSVLLLAWSGRRCAAACRRARDCRNPRRRSRASTRWCSTGSRRHEGQVKLEGEVWTARPLNDDDVYEPGDNVTVMHIDGATAVVWKLENP